MNKYEVLGESGEGAYGVVLKCRNKENGEIILLAIKKFKESEEDEMVKKSIIREVKVLKMFKHDNIVQLKEAFRRKGKLHLVFEYVERNLLEVLEERPSGLDPANIQMYIYQLCKAIDYCHSNSIIHRDIKPENLLVNKDGSLKLCDFGFARFLPQKVGELLTDYVATRWYRSPELVLSSTDYSMPVDIWAIGCILGELTDGQPLFPGENEIDQLFVIQKIMGPLIPDQMEAFQKNPRFIGMRFPEMSKPETLEKRYLGKLSKKAMAFMKDCLKMDPNQRLTAAKALQHPYFDNLRENVDTLPSRQSMRIESANMVTTNNAQMTSVGGVKIPTHIHNPSYIPSSNQAPNQNVPTTTNNNNGSQSTGSPPKNVQQININTNKPIDAITAEQQLKSLSLPRKSKPEQLGSFTHKLSNFEKSGDRSASLSKNVAKIEKIQQTYDSKKNKNGGSSPLYNQSQGSMNSKKSKVDVDHIDGNFSVPDVFMKNKYGNNQYNYDIKEEDVQDHEASNGKRSEMKIATKDFRETQNNFMKKKMVEEDHVYEDERKFASNSHTPLVPDRRPSQVSVKKAQMTPTVTQNKRNSKFSTMYGNFAEPAYSRGQSVADKTRKMKNKQGADNNGEGELFKTDSSNMQGDQYDAASQQSVNQLPMLASKLPSDKPLINVQNYEVLYGQSKAPVGWKGNKMNFGLPQVETKNLICSINKNTNFNFEAAENEQNHFNIVVNTNTYNYNYGGSPHLRKGKKRN